MRACSFKHEDIASLLLERSIALDPELGKHVDENPGRRAFITYCIEHRPSYAIEVGPWKAFVIERIIRTIHDDDLAAFVGQLQRTPWLLGDDWVAVQNRLIELACLNYGSKFIAAFLDLDPAILRRRPPPQSQAIEFAFTYKHTHLVPLLTGIWPLPDDLPHAAGMGDLARVRQWFDESGAPVDGLRNHYPFNDPRARSHLGWDVATTQQVLDVALAFAVTNDHFDVADFLLEHGADINTRWGSHEPASLLHHLISNGTYESMQFVIDRGIDMTIKDYRWGGTAQGWAYYANNDRNMARWLATQRQRRSN
ncbi:ankyrin repeat domain-containing protein, partial [Bradyrhizobium sp.]|uniref:ankyrin repeat domain-containing protein n=1 Tax=Bradyrhizobium sp. TaxID=376 RepID=UPI001EC8A098